MNVLITGGTGFVGLAVAEALQQSGIKAILFGRNAMPVQFETLLGKPPCFTGDIVSVSDIDRLLDATRPDAIIHLAAVTPDREAEMQDPAAVVTVNIGGTANLMRSVARLASRPRVILASSVAVYGEEAPSAGTYREDEFMPAPVSLYGITKFAAENTALRLAQLYGIELTIVRLGPVYGPWEYKTGLRPLLSPHAQVLDVWQQGDDVILPRALTGDWLYSRDAGRGIASLLSAGRLRHSIYNLGGGKLTSLAEWCEDLQPFHKAHGWKVAGPGDICNIRFGLSRDRAALSIDRIEADIGFRPVFTGRRAAQDYMSWLATTRG